MERTGGMAPDVVMCTRSYGKADCIFMGGDVQ